MAGGWPAFDALLPLLGFVPSRTGSVISTVYGDAVLPRGGSLALADLLVLMRRLGASDGVVRTAVSRLARDGVLVGRRTGRTSAYALSDRSRAEFEAAMPAIYGKLDRDWDGTLRLAFPEDPAERGRLEQAGFAALAPGVLVGFDDPNGSITLRASGMPDEVRVLCGRAWSSQDLNEEFAAFIEQFEPLGGTVVECPLDAMAARTMLLHAYRRLALRTPKLPAAVRPEGWKGGMARSCCARLYNAWAPLAEAWLDKASHGSGPLDRGPDPLTRFSDGGR